jgi:hypothetical protein
MLATAAPAAVGADGRRALHMVAAARRSAAVGSAVLALDESAVAVVDARGKSPLELAVEAGAPTAAVLTLLAPNPGAANIPLDDEGNTLFLQCCRDANHDYIRALYLNSGVNVKAQTYLKHTAEGRAFGNSATAKLLAELKLERAAQVLSVDFIAKFEAEKPRDFLRWARIPDATTGLLPLRQVLEATDWCAAADAAADTTQAAALHKLAKATPTAWLDGEMLRAPQKARELADRLIRAGCSAEALLLAAADAAHLEAGQHLVKTHFAKGTEKQPDGRVANEVGGLAADPNVADYFARLGALLGRFRVEANDHVSGTSKVLFAMDLEMKRRKVALKCMRNFEEFKRCVAAFTSCN